MQQMNAFSGPGDSISDVGDLRVGHAQDLEAGTGCTVILCPRGMVAAVDVRGGAPGTRETDCLDPANLIEHVHAVYLGGGSAFGLAGAEGVMRYLEEQGAGFDTGFGRVPIVPGAVLFDLNVGRSDVRPDADMGYRACLNARADEARQGNLGAGTGASVGKAAGPARMMKGGIGTASLAFGGQSATGQSATGQSATGQSATGQSAGELIVGALVALNCFGDVIDLAGGSIIAGTLRPDLRGFADSSLLLASSGGTQIFSRLTNTTLAVVATNAILTQAEAKRVAMMAHDGLARTIRPAHTLYDGDTVFCLAAGCIEADTSRVGAMAASALEHAVLAAARHAESAYGLPAHREIAARIAARGEPRS
jgi:L-aminopeptidase/D-esterase-like protein